MHTPNASFALFVFTASLLLCACSEFKAGPSTRFDPATATQPLRMGDTLHLPLNQFIGIKGSRDILFLKFTALLPDGGGVNYEAVHVSFSGNGLVTASTNGVVRWLRDPKDPEIPRTDGRPVRFGDTGFRSFGATSIVLEDKFSYGFLKDHNLPLNLTTNAMAEIKWVKPADIPNAW